MDGEQDRLWDEVLHAQIGAPFGRSGRDGRPPGVGRWMFRFRSYGVVFSDCVTARTVGTGRQRLMLVVPSIGTHGMLNVV